MEEEDDSQIVPMPNAPLGMVYLLVIPDDTDDWNDDSGVSNVRLGIVREIFRQGITTRPSHNIERNKSQLETAAAQGLENLQDYFHPT
jgi:hypothetical protein